MPLLLTRSLSILFGLALLMSAVACSYDSDLTDVTCDDEGATEEERTCVDGFWVQDYEDPPNNDDPNDDPNNDDPNQGCEPLDDDQLCIDEERECGTHDIDDDGCGEETTIECGDCGDEFCLEDSWTCSPCPDLSTDELCDTLLPDGEVCGEVELPDDCGDDAGTLECSCGDTQCGEWSECVIDENGCSGTRTRDCEVPDCVDNTECTTFETEEDQSCIASADSTCDEGVGECQSGLCDSDGNCNASDICDGTDTNCGCTECQDCSEQDDWYDADSPPVDCCDGDQICQCTLEEYREFECSGDECTYTVTEQRLENPTDCGGCTNSSGDPQSCTTDDCILDNPNTCSADGTQTETCTPYVCVADNGVSSATCEQDQNQQETEDVPCTLNTDGDTCDDPQSSTCDTGICSADESCEAPCSGEDDHCGCTEGECDDCSDSEFSDTVDIGNPYTACVDDAPVIRQGREQFQATCQDNQCSTDGVDGESMDPADVTADFIADDNGDLIDCDGGGNPSCNNNADDTSDITIPDEYESIACCDYSGDSNSSQCYVCFDDGTCELLED